MKAQHFLKTSFGGGRRRTSCTRERCVDIRRVGPLNHVLILSLLPGLAVQVVVHVVHAAAAHVSFDRVVTLAQTRDPGSEPESADDLHND